MINSSVVFFADIDVTISTFAESEDCISVYNIAPITPGHVLVIPKRQVVSLNDLSETEMQSFFFFARKVTNFIIKEFKATGFDWTIQDGVSAGQTVPHLHLHIIPRVEDDFQSPGDWYPVLKKSVEKSIDSDKREKLSEEEMERVVFELRERWGG